MLDVTKRVAGQNAASKRSEPRRASVRRVALLSIVLALVPWSLATCATAAHEPDAAPGVLDRIDRHLQAAEFGPALALACAIDQPKPRDSALAIIAQAQARAGARNAALITASVIHGDHLRTSTLDRLAETTWSRSAVGTGRNDSGGGFGGATMADFDTLIDLITSTIAPQSWDAVGGPGAVDSFPGGVFVDAGGLMQRARADTTATELGALRDQSAAVDQARDVRKASPLRKVSLTRLEKFVQLAAASGRAPTDAMRNLAGLYCVQYVFLYPDSRDVVIAGPAGAWQVAAEGRTQNVSSGAPVLQLDDLVVLLRNARDQGGKFGCSITPRRENLAATQAFLNESSQSPLKPGQREKWLAKIRQLMGKQAISVDGLDPRTRVARVIVEADYRMKLIGMGLEDGVLGVTSYLASMPPPDAGASPPLSVLRWWFAMHYEPLRATPARDAFELRGPSVQVLSENELLTQLGERIHTGASDELNEQFAHSFTKHFAALAAKYPIYADLRNVFDLAIIASLLMSEDVPQQFDWPMLHFGDPRRYHPAFGSAPTEVETVVNHRLVGQKHIVVGISGGVSADSTKYVRKSAMVIDDYGALGAGRTASEPRHLNEDVWWWD